MSIIIITIIVIINVTILSNIQDARSDLIWMLVEYVCHASQEALSIISRLTR